MAFILEMIIRWLRHNQALLGFSQEAHGGDEPCPPDPVRNRSNDLPRPLDDIGDAKGPSLGLVRNTGTPEGSGSPHVSIRE